MRRAFLRARAPSRQAVAARSLASASTPRYTPAAATAYATQPAPAEEYHPNIVDHSHPTHRHLTILPSPLPTDQAPTIQSSQLYPSSTLLDSLSLISVCLRRPETTPRAYDIFMRLLEEHREGRTALPEPGVWATVIEGAGAMARIVQDPLQKRTWTNRAYDLVQTYERYNGRMIVGREAVRIGNGGEKVYIGWLRGALHGQSSLDPILSYLVSGSLHVRDLVPGFKPSELPTMFDSLASAAVEAGLPDIARQVDEAKGMEEERREKAAAEIIAEVLPVMANSVRSGKAALEGTPMIPSEVANEPRWAIVNLRKALAELDSSDLPLNRQHRIEAASLEAARAELEHVAEKIVKSGLKDVKDSQKLAQDKLQSWMWQWLQALSARLRSDIDAMRRRKEEYEANIRSPASTGLRPTGPALRAMKKKIEQETDQLLYLNLLPPEKLALIAILETMRLAGTGGVTDGMKTLRAIMQIGKAVEAEYRITSLQDAMGKNPSNWLRSLQSGNGPGQQPLTRRQIDSVWKKLGRKIKDHTDAESKGLAEGEYKQLGEFIQRTEGNPNVYEAAMIAPLRNVWTPAWTQHIHTALGSTLLNALVEEAKVVRNVTDENGNEHFEEQAAFSHSYDYVKGKKLGLVVLNPAVVARVASDSLGVVIHPKHLPMLVEPRPWKAYDDGAYLHHRVPIMRFKDNVEQMTYLRKASDEGQLEYIYAGLDVLSSTPWMINRGVFDTVLKVWNSGEAIADIPPSETVAEYPMPEKPSLEDPDPQARAAYVLKVKERANKMWKDHAERCKFNYNLEIARSYINDVFYLPHNIDFRGRAYPIPPHLSPVGDDLCRGLLTFGEKKPLGPRGLMWLKIHLANVVGYDKASFKERETFAEQHMEDVLDSADRPLEGKRWWLKAEDPWQCLATCMELAAAARSPNPDEFMTGLPVHQDGTCNGMQHYAALGGDTRGARAVNLDAGDKPADVYTGVADLVNEIINRDAAAGKEFAKVVQGKVTRKVVKQSVMTTVYGVTFIGAKDQIAKQLIARGDVPRDHVFHCSGYIAKTVMNCIGDLFSGARAIQDWLTLSARLVSRCIPVNRLQYAVQDVVNNKAKKGPTVKSRMPKELMTTVTWTTPLQLPVVQPYRKPVRKQVMTALQSVYIADPNATAEVSPTKQASAFPPNFIHSLDATHMLLTAMKCRQNGVTFASVHDSYWTHAGSIDELSKNIRQTFIELHSQDIIGDLRREFLERYKDHRIPLHMAIQTLRNVNNAKHRLALEKADAEVEPEAEDSEDDFDQVESESSDGNSSGKSNRMPTFTVKHLLTAEGEPVVPEVVDGKKFVKLSDVLPACPPRGEFDINKIRNAPYFFS